MKGVVGIIICVLYLTAIVVSQCPDANWSGSLWSSSNYGGVVTIPEGSKVLFDVAFANVTSISVAGSLVFKNQVSTLNVQWIRVEVTGSIIMGSEDCPIDKKVTVMFYGPRTTTSDMGTNPSDSATLGSKGLSITSNATLGGTISLHGKVNSPSFTRINKNVLPGATSITVDDNVSWQVGDKIVITSTDYSEIFDYRSNYSRSYPSLSWGIGISSPDQSEVVTITGISGNTISFTPALQYLHWGSDFERAEVGLLSRYIVLTGDPTSDTSHFGGHVIVRTASLAQVSGVEVTRMGQLGVLGRYPIHYHLMFQHSIGKGFYISSNSFHDNFQRSITIHGSNGIMIAENVAYNCYGHMYFLEDGSEEWNTWHHNLGVSAQPVPDEGINGINHVIPTDVQPSIFWITNPNNSFTENVAVGGRFGYWFALPPTPTGTSSGPSYFPPDTSRIRPRTTPLRQFDYNIGHSSADNCFHVDDMPDLSLEVALASWTPYYPPYFQPNSTTLYANYYLTPAEAIMNGLIMYKCRNFGIWSRGGYTHYTNATCLDNRVGYNNPPAGPSLLENSLIWGETNNPGTPRTKEGPRQTPPQWMGNYVLEGVSTYDNGGPQYIRDIKLVNFTSYGADTNYQRPAGGFTPLFNGPFGHQTRNRYYGITFDDETNPNRVWVNQSFADGPKDFTIYNTDSSIVGPDFPLGGWMLSNNAPGQIMLNPTADACTFRADWDAWVCPPFGEGYIQLQFLINNMPAYASAAGGVTAAVFNATFAQNNYGTYVNRASFYNLETKGEHQMMGKFEDDNVGYNFDINLAPRKAYTVRFANGSVTPSSLRLSMQSSVAGDWMIFVIPYPTSAGPFTITYSNYNPSASKTLTAATSLNGLQQGTYYFDGSAGNLYVWLENTNGNSWSTWWNMTDYNFDGGVYLITATGCGGAACPAVSSNTLNTIPAVPAITYDYEDTYRADLLPACSANHASDGSGGSAWIFFNTQTKEVNLALYHNVDPRIVSSIVITDMGNNGRTIADLSITPSSPVRRTFAISHNSWNSLASGKLLVTITYNNGRAVGGLFGCVNTSDCTAPTAILAPITCVAEQTSTQLINAPVLLDGPLPGYPRWSSWSWNGSKPDTYLTSINFNSTESVLCGNNSIAVGLQNGALNLAFPGNPGQNVSMFTINPTLTPYLQFWARTKNPSTTLTLRVSLNDGTKGYALQVGTQYVLNYVIEETWTRVDIPVADFGMPVTSLQTIQQVTFQQWPGYGNSYMEFYVDEIVFTNAKDNAVNGTSFGTFGMYRSGQGCSSDIVDTGSAAVRLEFGFWVSLCFDLLSYLF